MSDTKASQMAAQQPKKRLSLKIEETVEGLFKFVFRFSKLWIICAFRPFKACRVIEQDISEQESTIVLPFTYFALTFFLISFIVGATGPNLVNTVWVTQDVARQIHERLVDGVSTLDVSLAALPGIACLFGLSWCVGRVALGSQELATSFTRLSCYVFGTQGLILIALVAFILYDTIESDNGIFWFQRWLHVEYAEQILFAVFWGVVGYLLIYPFLALIPTYRMLCKQAHRATTWHGYLTVLGGAVLIPAVVWCSGLLVPQFVQAIEINEEPEVYGVVTDPGYAWRGCGRTFVAIPVHIRNETEMSLQIIPEDSNGTLAQQADDDVSQEDNADLAESEPNPPEYTDTCFFVGANGDRLATMTVEPEGSASLFFILVYGQGANILETLDEWDQYGTFVANLQIGGTGWVDFSTCSITLQPPMASSKWWIDRLCETGIEEPVGKPRAAEPDDC